MKHKSLTLCLIFLSGFGLVGLQAQTSINVTGSNASGSGGTVSYSIGQVFYQNNTGTSGSVEEGVQQSFEISTISVSEYGETIGLMIYPNPTTENLNLKIENYNLSDLSYQLCDTHGRVLQSKKITDKESCIKTIELIPATYYLTIIRERKTIKTFKIIKQ